MVQGVLGVYGPGSRSYGPTDSGQSVSSPELDQFIWDVLGKLDIQQGTTGASELHAKVKKLVIEALAKQAAEVAASALLARAFPEVMKG